MNNRQKIWLWLSAAILFVVGFILVMSDSSEFFSHHLGQYLPLHLNKH